ncbi:FkbM family methyltransferase [Bradyrhizobium sp.]|jgi:FkbM family methyltransferase|uniref:FkbM family methyltransferase n=1 Tax=Bradyrhizobium sp. TaxID=376 RepID=UPI00391985F6
MPPAPRNVLEQLGPDALVFDRRSGKLDGATPFSRALVAGLQAGSIATEPFGHRGYGLGCRLIGAFAQQRDLIVRLNEDAAFAMPFCDSYWSRLLNRNYDYEEEIEAFLESVRNDQYVFVDCGANFGYWSVLVSSQPYGSQQAIAIEASAANAKRLRQNAKLNGNRFRCLHAAVGGSDAGLVRVVGTKHEKLATVPLKEQAPDAVKMLSLDRLAETGVIDAKRPIVVKLDVEGVEIAALQGARTLLATGCLVICEEHGADPTHSVSRYLLETLKLSIVVFDAVARKFCLLDDLGMLDRIKRHAWVGYNVFATLNPAWTSRLLREGRSG